MEEMDDINVLLTEVSLELLGNTFYDIHGQAHSTLRELYLPNVEVKPNYDPYKSELMREIIRSNSDAVLPVNTIAKKSTRNRQQRKSNPADPAPRKQQSPIDLVETEIKNNVAKGRFADFIKTNIKC